jgi:hypothetical protein
MTILTCWTCSSLETQPVLRPSTTDGGGSSIDLALTVGVWTASTSVPSLTFRAECYAQGSWQPYAGDLSVVELTAPVIDQRADGCATEYGWLEAHRHSSDVRAVVDSRADNPRHIPGNRYYEISLISLPTSGLVRFEVTAALADPVVVATAHGALWLVAPTFDGDDLRESRTSRLAPSGDPATSAEVLLPDDQWWVLLVKENDHGFDHIRLDLLRTDDVANDTAITPVRIRLNDGEPIDVTSPAPLPWTGKGADDYVWPIVDRSTDSILVSVKRSAARPLRTVEIITGRGQSEDSRAISLDPWDLDQDYGFRPTALILLQYCIQGFNDLFASPIAAYRPPRNYIEVTFADEAAAYSSRPGIRENGIPDGYRYALEAQRDYQVKTQWAFNAGVLTLLRYGLSAPEFSLLTDQVTSGLISPSNAGFGAHRPPYYQRDSNQRELVLAERVIESSFGRGSDRTYYPDQRIYLARPAEIDTYSTLCGRDQLHYIVLDRSTVAGQVDGTDICLFGEGHPTGDDGNYLWREAATGLTVLLIEDQLRNEMLNAGPDETLKGQLGYWLRRRLMLAVRFRKPGPSKIYVYGDDLDHACGDGWFDGSPIFYTRGYLAALCWISSHPWVRAWTVDEDGFDPTLYRQNEPITVTSAICPSVDPLGVESFDQQGNQIHFNTWYQWWASTASTWLGCSLRELSDSLEDQLVAWPERYRNGMYELAWMYFLACTHESMWSQQPLTNPNGDRQAWPPEDFVISESIQQRHAWVYLNASIWAHWSDGQPSADDSRTYVIGGSDAGQSELSGGPLLGLVREQGSADPYWPSDHSVDQRGAYWDHDCLRTIVLYNRRSLVVIDRNGGRITNIFCRVDGRAISVSGTIKSHQFLTPGPIDQIPADGMRLQNTVFTPNHCYVASDVDQAAWLPGTYVDSRQPDQPQLAWYPDNFNAYDCAVDTSGDAPVVTCRYGPPVGDQPTGPITPAQFDAACQVDGAARRAGQPGIVWHSGTEFRKTVRLVDDRIEIRYAGVAPGHAVSNEFTVDLERAVLDGIGQRRTADPSGVRVTVDSTAGFRVAVELHENCVFAAEQLPLTVPSDNGQPGRSESYNALRRVLTEDLRVTCVAGDRFGYDVVLPT